VEENQTRAGNKFDNAYNVGEVIRREKVHRIAHEGALPNTEA
jgi:hypothetical protein